MSKRGNGEGSIYSRKDGRWVAAVIQADGKRKSVYGKTREDVGRRLTVALKARDDGVSLPSDRGTFGAYLTDWLEASRSTVRPRTWQRYEQLSRVHVVPALGRTPLVRLQPGQLQRLYAARLAAGCAPMTVRHIHAVLHRALGQAQRWGLVARNVAELADPPRAPRYEMKTLDEAQTRALLDAVAGDRLEALYVLAVTSGMRQGELLGLRWCDVDLDRGVLQVRTTLERSGRTVALAEPKTRSSRRAVVLTKIAVAGLRRHHSRQAIERIAAGAAWQDLDLVFANIVGRPLDGTKLVKLFHATLARSGLPRIRFHDLRHTAATLLLGRGIHPKIVSEQLGHAQVAITLDTYSHVTPTMQREAAAAIDAALTAT